MGKRELVALLNLSSWCLVMVERLFHAVLWGCLRFVIVVFPDHTHLLFFIIVKFCIFSVVTFSCELYIWYNCYIVFFFSSKLFIRVKHYTY